MGRKILIVDDDADFNQLLTDIFSQANYEVDPEEDPEAAFEKFKAGNYDLVVTDQKMPGLTGEELIRLLKQHRPDIPIIMVSGYLDNDTIRNLIREGVGGVFLKPLNVFSLLKRTATLIEEREAGLRREQADDEDDDESFEHNLPFKFTMFPAKDRVAREFAQKLHNIADFKTNLVLVAPRGTDLGALVNDLNGFESEYRESYRLLDRSELLEPTLIQLIDEAAKKRVERLTFVVASAETVSREQFSLIMRLGRKKEPFDKLAFPVRFVFCITRDLDALYDERIVDDAVYMFMGTTELTVPRLADIQDDIPELARRYVEAEAAALGKLKAPKLELSAKTYLREQSWSGNAAELHRFMRMAVQLDRPSLSMDDLARVEQKLAAAVGGGKTLLHGLKLYRDEYIKAIATLLEGDPASLGEALGVDQAIVEEALR